jgi:hypothetical protein
MLSAYYINKNEFVDKAKAGYEFPTGTCYVMVEELTIKERFLNLGNTTKRVFRIVKDKTINLYKRFMETDYLFDNKAYKYTVNVGLVVVNLLIAIAILTGFMIVTDGAFKFSLINTIVVLTINALVVFKRTRLLMKLFL